MRKASRTKMKQDTGAHEIVGGRCGPMQSRQAAGTQRKRKLLGVASDKG